MCISFKKSAAKKIKPETKNSQMCSVVFEPGMQFYSQNSLMMGIVKKWYSPLQFLLVVYF